MTREKLEKINTLTERINDLDNAISNINIYNFNRICSFIPELRGIAIKMLKEKLQECEQEFNKL